MKRPLSAVLLLGLLIAASAPAPAATPSTDQRVVLAGGCFWGMQLVFEQLKGVDRVVAGYAGGEASTAQYETVSTGATGHAESVEITYDPSQISYGRLLQVFFAVAHDPTELNRQGPDQGTQYRSEIFYTTGEQRTTALATIAHLDSTHAYPSRIVTTVAPLHGFYPAEAYHQDYARHNPENPYIAFNDLPKLKVLRQDFPQLIKPNAWYPS